MASLNQVMSEARQLLTKLHDREKLADNLVTYGNCLNERINCMKEYQEEVVDFRSSCNEGKPRSNLVQSLQRENRQIRQLQDDNRQLKVSLEEHQATLDIVMQRHRQLMYKVVNLSKLQNLAEKQVQLTEQKQEESGLRYSKQLEFSSVFDRCLRLGEEDANKDFEEIVRLKTENSVLRQLLKIGVGNEPRLAQAFNDRGGVADAERRRSGLDDFAGDVLENGEKTPTEENADSPFGSPSPPPPPPVKAVTHADSQLNGPITKVSINHTPAPSVKKAVKSDSPVSSVDNAADCDPPFEGAFCANSLPATVSVSGSTQPVISGDDGGVATTVAGSSMPPAVTTKSQSSSAISTAASGSAIIKVSSPSNATAKLNGNNNARVSTATGGGGSSSTTVIRSVIKRTASAGIAALVNGTTTAVSPPAKTTPPAATTAKRQSVPSSTTIRASPATTTPVGGSGKRKSDLGPPTNNNSQETAVGGKDGGVGLPKKPVVGSSANVVNGPVKTMNAAVKT